MSKVFCAYHGCHKFLARIDTISDGEDYWLEDCRCHEEDRKHYCVEHKRRAACEACDRGENVI